MDREECYFGISIFLFFTISVCAILSYSAYSTKMFVEGGYEQAVLVGHHDLAWVKPSSITKECPNARNQ